MSFDFCCKFLAYIHSANLFVFFSKRAGGMGARCLVLIHGLPAVFREPHGRFGDLLHLHGHIHSRLCGVVHRTFSYSFVSSS